MPEPMTRRRAPGGQGRSSDTLHPLQVRYYKRMRRGRTYAVEVGWRSAERGVAARPVTLRLEVAGAIVVPAEQVLRPADPEDAVTFYVTPLGKGKLRHQTIEVRYDNAKIFEMPLRSRVSTQRFTLFLLIMTFLAPWLLTNYCKSPYKKDGLGPKESMSALIEDNLPDLTEFNDMLPEWAPVKEWARKGAELTGTGYAELCEWCQRYPIATCTCLSFLGLTLISAWWHKPKRRWRTSEPIPLTP